MLWVNSPSNPTGALERSGRGRGVGSGARRAGVQRRVLRRVHLGRPGARASCSPGLDGVVAVHSLSKRSNLAGVRVGFYAGDAELVGYLREVRKHVGMLVPGPAQAAGRGRPRRRGRTSRVQRDRYRRRLERLAGDPRRVVGLDVPMPAGGFYLWFDAGDGWAFAERLMAEGGALVSPGDFYGAGGAQNVRAAVVQPDDRIELIARRLGVH